MQLLDVGADELLQNNRVSKPNLEHMSTIFDGTGGGIISQSTAEDYLSNYQQGPSYTWNQGVKGHYFNKDFFDDLLEQTGAVGIRIYYGSRVNTSNVLVPELVMVAVDEDGNDILSNDIIVDVSKACPPVCPTSGLGT